jgi:hypothetical protein
LVPVMLAAWPADLAGRYGLRIIQLALQSAMNAGDIVERPHRAACRTSIRGVDHSVNIREHKDLAFGWAVRATAPPDNIHRRT